MSSLDCVSPLYEIVISKEEIALWLYLQLTKVSVKPLALTKG